MNRSIPLPNITVAQLQYLVAAVDAETWSEAATRLDVSQSALSQGLAELQRRVGIELFDRHGRRRVARAEAAPVIEHARRVLAQTRDLATWARGVREGSGGRLRVGMIDAAAIDHFGGALRSFRVDHPEVDLHLQVAPSSQLVVDAVRGDLDVVVCVTPDHPDLAVEALVEEPIYVYAPDAAAAATPDEWGPWVSFPTGSSTRSLIESALREMGATFDVVAESHQPEVLREMVRLGMGWTALPPAQAERPPDALRPVLSQPLVHRELAAVTRRHAIVHPAAARLIEVLRGA